HDDLAGEVSWSETGGSVPPITLKWRQYLDSLAAPAALLDVHILAAAAVSDAGFSNLGGVNRVGRINILRTDDTLNGYFTYIVIHQEFLLAVDDIIAVGQYLRDHGGNLRLHSFFAFRGYVALLAFTSGDVNQFAGVGFSWQQLEFLFQPECGRCCNVLAAASCGTRIVIKFRL